jgi:hypothetical protein
MFVQSGLYVDFFIKKIGEVFIKNFMVLTPLFFGEKYLIEVLTKKIVENFLFRFNKFIGLSSLTFFNFFYIFLILVFNMVTFINFFYIFLVL